jgi:hypothetical protein
MATSRITNYSILGELPSERARVFGDISAPRFASPNGPSRTMHFLVKREPRLLGFCRSLAVLCAHTSRLTSNGPIHFFRNQPLTQFKLRPRSFSASVLFHCSMIALLVYLPHVLPAESTTDIRPEAPLTEAIYFRVPLEDTTKPLPKKTAVDPDKPVEPVKPPDAAESAPPKTENTVSYGSLTIVSKPVRPDNLHQTIIQLQSPPDLKIPNDVKVPNIVLVLAKQPDIAKPALDIKPSDSRPMRANKQVASVAVPRLAATQQNPLLPVPDAVEIARPKYVPAPTGAKPQQAQRQVASAAAPTVAPTQQTSVLPLSTTSDVARPRYIPPASDAKPQGRERQITGLAAPSVAAAQQNSILPLAGATDIARPLVPSSDAKPVKAQKQMASMQAPAVGGPQLAALPDGITEGTTPSLRPPMPAASSAAPQARHFEGSTRANQASAAPSLTAGTGGDKVDLVAIGINPADPSSEIKLPPGNRSGEFAITPAESSTGSGKPSSSDGNANAAKTLAASGTGTLSITGPRASDDGTGMLDPLATEVFPVPAALLPKARANHLVVSTGPMGGGGLNLYGAMQCGRIYTVFLEMPKDSWTLQFCEKKPDGAQAAPQASSGVIQLETPIAPPDAEERFDFQRLPVSPEKAHKLIILKGIIREDGTVDQVEVFQGILPQMDEAARLALSKWKFKPALRGDKAVPLQILVGIPVTATTNP